MKTEQLIQLHKNRQTKANGSMFNLATGQWFNKYTYGEYTIYMAKNKVYDKYKNGKDKKTYSLKENGYFEITKGHSTIVIESGVLF